MYTQCVHNACVYFKYSHIVRARVVCTCVLLLSLCVCVCVYIVYVCVSYMCVYVCNNYFTQCACLGSGMSRAAAD